jgi:aminopeptidase N
MEHASAIFYGQTSITDRPATGLVAHEIAHQWFGNAVTESDWDDAWLSEGFATYFTHLTREHYSGRDSFISGLIRDKDRIAQMEERLPGQAVVHDNLDDMGRVLSGIQYQKGGWVLHMLRGQIGTDNFWAGIRDYYATYKDSNASSADLQRVMEEASGQELSWFFEQWLHRAPTPVVEGSWSYDASSQSVVVELTQTQATEPYTLPFELEIAGDWEADEPEDPRGRRRGDVEPPLERIEMTGATQRFEIPVKGRPDSVVLDPNTWILMHVTFGPR